jgi:DGQHR domain-containing protein
METDAARLKREATQRRKSHEETSQPKAMVPAYVDDGWEVVRELKRKVALRRQWPHDKRLENRTWLLFFLLGYPQISAGRNFKVRIERKGADSFEKQIDVFAKDDETVVVAECKSCAKPDRRSLQKDIEEFASLKAPIAQAVRKHYGSDFKPKIIWLFVSDNIQWSKPDRERAAGCQIHVITERELSYYLQIAEHLRSAARYQFLADFLRDTTIPEMENVRVPAVRGKLGGQTFYSFVSTPKQMLKIAFVNHRSLNDPEGAPAYQRLVSRGRLRQIGDFLKKGGYFPTNILVNFSQKCRFDQIAKDDENDVAFGHLYLPSKYRSAWIIDGQHRLYGYAPLPKEQLVQNIMVVAFENMSKSQEADLFVTINHEQKSVPKTLLDDLEGDLKWGSSKPSERLGSICSRLVTLLNSDLGEPLYGRVTQQGIRSTSKTCLTVPELKDGFRRSGLVGTVVMKGMEYSPGPLCDIDDGRTLQRARTVLNSYFSRVYGANTVLWDMGKDGFICTNRSLRAYIQLLASLIEYMEKKKSLSARELEPVDLMVELEEYLAPVLAWLSQATPADAAEQFDVKYGSGGPREYHFRLSRLVQGAFPDFEPEGLAQWIEEQSEERIGEANRKIKELSIQVQKCIFDKFKEMYGDDYWDRGVLDKKIKLNAYEKSLDYDSDTRLPLENYLDFIEYKKVVENKTHWPQFKALFDIPEPGMKGISKNLAWMDRVNELRRVEAHPTEIRSYTVADFEYIDWIHGEFMRRLSGHELALAADSTRTSR